MDIGTTDTVEETRVKTRRRAGATGNGGNGNAGRGGGDDNNNHSDGNDRADTYVPGKARILTWFLLLVVLMTFGGLTAAYIMTATNHAIEWRPFALPVQVWISTALILISSAVYHRGKVALDNYERRTAKKWLTATTILGAAFISSQLLAWLELSRRGLYLSANPYAGFFYILTGVHAVHVLGGIIALGSVVLKSWNPVGSDQEWFRLRSLGQVVGWYWHFMAGVWVALFLLLGFWQ